MDNVYCSDLVKSVVSIILSLFPVTSVIVSCFHSYQSSDRSICPVWFVRLSCWQFLVHQTVQISFVRSLHFEQQKGAPDLAVSFLIAISNCAPFPKGTYLIESGLKPFGKIVSNTATHRVSRLKFSNPPFLTSHSYLSSLALLMIDSFLFSHTVFQLLIIQFSLLEDERQFLVFNKVNQSVEACSILSGHVKYDIPMLCFTDVN